MRIDDELDELDGADVGGTLQAGSAAGESATSGNGVDPEMSTVEPDNTGDELDDGVDSDETDADEPADGPADHDDDRDDDGEPVGELARARRQAARYRRELRDTETQLDELRASLWRTRVELDGRLADPDDLPLDADALDDPDKLRELVDDLLDRKPHLRSRRITTRAGQGEGTATASVSLADMLRRNA